MNNSNTLPRMPSTSPKLKSGRSMPQWMIEHHNKLGPKPPAIPPDIINERPPSLPPKRNQSEPDYEVIEFGQQQYSNSQPIRPKSSDSSGRSDGLKCTLCGSPNPWVRCEQCAQQIFCTSCDDMFHRHPKRQTHLRKAIEKSQATFKPPLPPKIDNSSLTIPPVPPPRRNKKCIPSPLPLRKEQVIGSTSSAANATGSFKRHNMMMTNQGTRPLPETPIDRTPSPRSNTSTPNNNNNRSIFDVIQRPPSLTLERIKTKASATLDRMTLLQQRYRQHQEQIKHNDRSSDDINDRHSNDSFPNVAAINNNNNNNHLHHQYHHHHLPQQQRTEMPTNHRPPITQSPMKNISASVFNLNHNDIQQLPSRSWSPMQSAMQQTQSTTQLNCMNCNNHQGWNPGHSGYDGWNDCSAANLNGSNMSLNLPPPGYYPPNQQQHMMHHAPPPPAWLNAWGTSHMYPYPPMGLMPIMNNGMMGNLYPPRSRAQSRVPSRAASPALSLKSRKSMMSTRNKRNSYIEPDATDDEDSEDDRSSIRSSAIINNRRQRKNSVTSHNYTNEEDSDFVRKSTNRNSQRSGRDLRSGSLSKAVPIERTSSSRRPSMNTIRDRSERESVSSKKVYSDSPMTPDSESEPATRALVQAKIQEKLIQQKKQQHDETIQTKQQISNTINNRKMIQTKIEDENTTSNDRTHSESSKRTESSPEQIDDTSSLGPPPSTPSHEWECEFCTFVNEPNVKICAICCKTPTHAPLPINNNKNSSTMTTVQPSSSNLVNNKNSQNTDVVMSNSMMNTLKISQSEDDSEDKTHGSTNKKKVNDRKQEQNHNRNHLNHRNDIDSNSSSNSTNNDKITKIQKVSTGCGTSPPKEIKKKKIVSESVSTGTSPPPQSISTQTYEELSLPLIINNELQQKPNIGRSLSIASPHSIKLSERSQSRQSVNSESQSLPPTPPKRYMSPSNVSRGSVLDSPNHIINSGTLSYLEKNLKNLQDISLTRNDRYRSQNDLRHPNLYLQRKTSISDLLNYQNVIKNQSHINDTFDHFDYGRKADIGVKQKDPGLELVFLLKEAEHYKYTAEELQAALKHCGDIHPITWLRENWSKLIQTVQTLATKYGQERKENTIGTISAIEAREALRIHKGNVWHAITECIEQRQKKYNDIANHGNYSREDIVTALTAHHGNLELAILDLSKTQLKPFLMHIWGPPTGVENESGNQDSSNSTAAESKFG